MNIGHLTRYRDIARLLVRYGRSDLVKAGGLEEIPDEKDLTKDTPATELAERFVRDMEKLGPTYIKLGQLLSTRSDLLPPSFLVALARLQDDVEAFPYEKVEEIVTAELGVRISKAFERSPTSVRWRRWTSTASCSPTNCSAPTCTRSWWMASCTPTPIPGM